MTSFKDFLEEQLRDEEFAREYEEVSAEMDLAVALVKRREKLGLTQQEVADSTGIKQPMIARIEGGQMPSPKTLQRLAKALGVGIMFTGEGVMVLPYATSKPIVRTDESGKHYRPNLWSVPAQKLAHKRHKIESDYALLRRMIETENIGRTPMQKEKPNAGLELAA